MHSRACFLVVGCYKHEVIEIRSASHLPHPAMPTNTVHNKGIPYDEIVQDSANEWSISSMLTHSVSLYRHPILLLMSANISLMTLKNEMRT